MTDQLRNPDLPPGAVVEVRDDGVAIRNYGRELQPAARNPWYVLMTVAGEIEGDYDPDDVEQQTRISRNRRYWNGWACSEMSEEKRADLTEKMSLAPEELSPLSKEEFAELSAEFARRLGEDARIPSRWDRIDFHDRVDSAH